MRFVPKVVDLSYGGFLFFFLMLAVPLAGVLDDLIWFEANGRDSEVVSLAH